MVPTLMSFDGLMREQSDILGGVSTLLATAGIPYALFGAHALNCYLEPSDARTTADVDLIVSRLHIEDVRAAFTREGYTLRLLGDLLRGWLPGSAPEKDPPRVDLVQAEDHPLLHEAYRRATPVRYLGVAIPVPPRAVLAVQKFGSAISLRRSVAKRLQDTADLAKLVTTRWSDADHADALQTADLVYSGARKELERLIDDIRHGRRITI